MPDQSHPLADIDTCNSVESLHTVMSEIDMYVFLRQPDIEQVLSRPTKLAVRRIQRAKAHFGSYRHDLIVALNLLNKLEEQVIRKEWKSWLSIESVRCKQMELLLYDDKMFAESFEEQLDWWTAYCNSCYSEVESRV